MPTLSTLRFSAAQAIPVRTNFNGLDLTFQAIRSTTSYNEEVPGFPLLMFEASMQPGADALGCVSHFGVSFKPHYHTEFEGPLQEGEKYWYCGRCQDGPMGIWYNACTNCGHIRDNCCRVEEK
ncbi:hypothetical protein CC80DRAFT_489141 [Byssothecium circinans]|uniref:Uncharacterized protein n=1 Tax=Byssothecium circinans TaxID=147558 RepID=A0A6A5U880_9PLEO|nr:hypothetical protein CC80DRAFT_489141 [Byssothecium circinans]